MFVFAEILISDLDKICAIVKCHESVSHDLGHPLCLDSCHGMDDSSNIDPMLNSIVDDQCSFSLLQSLLFR